MQMFHKKSIYIILMHTGTIPARFIRFVTRYKYSHVVLSLERDCKTTYSFGRKDLNNFLNSGFIEEEQNGAFFKKFDKTKCRIYELEVTENQYDFLKNILDDRISHKNEYKYDFVGMVLRFFHIPVCFENKFVCSQFVAEILEEGHVINFEKPSYFVNARDFDNLSELKEVYEGLYLDYNVNMTNSVAS